MDAQGGDLSNEAAAIAETGDHVMVKSHPAFTRRLSLGSQFFEAAVPARCGAGNGCAMTAAIFERANIAGGGDRHCQSGIVASNVFTEINMFADIPPMRGGSYSLG